MFQYLQGEILWHGFPVLNTPDRERELAAQHNPVVPIKSVAAPAGLQFLPGERAQATEVALQRRREGAASQPMASAQAYLIEKLSGGISAESSPGRHRSRRARRRGGRPRSWLGRPPTHGGISLR